MGEQVSYSLSEAVAENTSGISGNRISPFFTRDFEGFDINKETDWLLAENLIKDSKVTLPNIKHTSFRG